MFGFLNVYKPQGMTSHDVVAVLRRVIKIKQIGHTGTLDPFAEGVLPICIGKSTRLIEYLEDYKAYVATIQFGKSTTTYDLEGEVINESDKKVLFDDIKRAIKNFQGKIKQLPPIYSAIKVNGKKLYDYARKGEEVEIKPRLVNIYKLEIINFDYKNQTLEILIECSKGTYIRSIANDLGENLGCFAYLKKLVRTKAGKFEINNSLRIEELTSCSFVEQNLINPLEYLNYPKYLLTDEEQKKVSNGMAIDIIYDDGKVVLVSKNTVVAIADVISHKAKILKVFL